MATKGKESPELKNLRIQTNMVKRLLKDVQSYAAEQQRDTERIEKLQAEHADEHDIKKQQEVLAETAAMIEDTKTRLEDAKERLAELVEAAEKSELTETEVFKQAKELLQ